MAREIDESWIDEAIDRYRRLDRLRAEFDQVVASHSVSVHSPDDTIEVIVTAAGEITDVHISGSLHQRNAAEFAREIQAVVTSAAEAARWARAKLHGEIFGKLKED
ncbi:YbaB/EbfC family nucleoid-associated protein [Actinoplanes sp. KI2]|uniref:YbaB/EbfC family nucleoid-associated protein n=1 Tax=Actinoplanes sp. KI2 TaxID=2983315 RepID=UPI0021D5E62B|nr:YbaB/EbfC family nucleoid-associated protein [Actinoplanes sp. KI2]MCU7724185.1 YbaB/EbfC family nucleoid-associated protein [Actinoplanes sp. KI2]